MDTLSSVIIDIISMGDAFSFHIYHQQNGGFQASVTVDGELFVQTSDSSLSEAISNLYAVIGNAPCPQLDNSNEVDKFVKELSRRSTDLSVRWHPDTGIAQQFNVQADLHNGRRRIRVGQTAEEALQRVYNNVLNNY